MRLLTVLLLSVLPVGLCAQEAATTAPLTATLTPMIPVGEAGGTAELRLTVTVNADSSIDAAVLGGLKIESTVEGKDGPSIDEGPSGKVKVKAGTKIERTLAVPLARIVPNPSASGMTRVTFKWPGLVGASAAFSVVPNPDSIDLAKIDLARTKVLLVTNFGNMTVSFFAKKAPNHARNFIKLSKERFFDGTRFHRVIRGFMIQGGCPNTKKGASGAPGTGNPGYTVDAEFNDTKHVRGILSAARSSDPNSHGCQFFVVHGEAAWLDNQYTAFGKLSEGLDALDRIGDVQVRPNASGENSVPTVDVHLYRAIVLPEFK